MFEIEVQEATVIIQNTVVKNPVIQISTKSAGVCIDLRKAKVIDKGGFGFTVSQEGATATIWATEAQKAEIRAAISATLEADLAESAQP